MLAAPPRTPPTPPQQASDLLADGEVIVASVRSVDAKDLSSDMQFAEVVATDRRLLLRSGSSWMSCNYGQLRDIQSGPASGQAPWVLGFINPETHRYLTLFIFDLEVGETVDRAIRSYRP